MTIDALIVGAGPIGLACAIAAKRRGLDPLVIDAGAVANSIVRYPVGMTFFTTADRLEIGGHPLVCAGQKPVREEALKYYRGVVRTEQIRVRPYVRLTGVRQEDDGLEAEVETRHGPERLACAKLVLATGYYDHPNPLGVPGEELPHVSHYFDEPHKSYGLDVVVIGGKNSAVEAALELFRAGARVTLVYRGPALKETVKYWLKPDIENRIRDGEIAARFGAQVTRIEPRAVAIRTADGGVESIPADRVYALTWAVGIACVGVAGVLLAPGLVASGRERLAMTRKPEGDAAHARSDAAEDLVRNGAGGFGPVGRELGRVPLGRIDQRLVTGQTAVEVLLVGAGR